jgi:hypothetical protein
MREPTETRLPLHGRFLVRSNIEAWCQPDLERAGCQPGQVREMDYFSVYLRYWEQYHVRLATNMVLAHPHCRVVPYGAETLRSLAQRYHETHGSGLRAAPFRFHARNSNTRYDKPANSTPAWRVDSGTTALRAAYRYSASSIELSIVDANRVDDPFDALGLMSKVFSFSAL